MKKWIKYLMLIFSIFMVGTLSACTNNKVTDSKVVPTYKGMVVERDNTQQLDLPFIDDDDLFDDDDDLDDDIEDLVTIKIITDDSIKYNVLPGEVFNLHVKLENPDEFEIQSFKLNGKKYANYMFEDGSDMENLYLKVIAPMEPGYYDYTIDAIKYIDGDDIEDVNLSKGNQSIKVGVRHAVLPTVNDVTKIVDTTKIALQLTLNDKDNLLEDKDVKIYLSNGKKVIDEQPIKLGVNNILFDNLKEDKLYQYAVMTSFDLCDGEYEKERTLFKESVRTKGIYSVSDALISQESIEFSLTKNGEVGELTTVSLHDKENKYALVENLTDLNNLKFSNLLSNHNYTIKVAYNYKINNVDTKGSVLYHFITKEKIAPTLTFVNVIATQDKIDFDYKVIDHDSLLKINSIALYDGSKIVKILTNLNERSFDKLLSNHNYMIRIDYSYDLNNGNGINKKFITYEIKTEEKLTPKVNIINIVSSQSKIDYDIDVVDMDKTYHLEKVELYLNSKLVDRKLVEEPFEGLLSNTKYELKVTYSYDLNDEMGKKFVTLSKEIMTKEKIAPKVNIQNVNTNQDAITFEYEITNTDVLYSIKTIELYKGDKLVNSITELDKKEFINLLSNTDYTIKIIYSYDLNDGKGKQESIATTTCHTKEKMAPTVTIENIIESQTTIEFNTNVKDLDGVYQLIKIDLYDGSHLVKSLTKEDALLFDGLYSNRAYTIKLVYSYDLNDGSGVKEVTVSKDAITLAKVAPSLTIKDTSSTQTSINYNYDIIDTDNILNIDKIELLLNGEVVDTKLSLEEFTGLLSGKEYVLRITYSYDLNEGTGAQIKVVETNLKTLSKVAPKVEITNTTSTQTSINYDVTIDDKDGLYVFNKVELYLGEQLIKSKKVIEPFEGLLSGKKYTIEFTYSYNLNDGTGFKEIILSKEVLTLGKVAPILVINNTSSTQTSIYYNYDILDPNNILVIKKIDLLLKGEIVDTKFELDEFSGLLSNTEYELRITYSYDLNDGSGVQTKTVATSIKTLAKVVPVVEIKSLTSDQTSISFNIDVQDVNSIYNLVKVELYNNGKLVKTLENLSHREFNDLLSNTEYVVKVTYSYDLNDGKGPQTKEVSNSIFTKEKVAPVVEITNTSSNQTIINYEVNVVDRDGIYVFDRVELYLSGKLVETKTSLEAFNNLLSNKQYTIKVIYKYNLNDGTGVKERLVSKDVITLAKVAPNLVINNTSSTKTSIKYDYEITDIDNILEIKSIDLLLNGEVVDTKTSLEEFMGLLSNTEYVLRITYAYDLNDGTGVQIKVVETNVKTLAKIAPTLTIKDTSSTQTSINYNYDIIDIDNILEIKKIDLLLNGDVVATRMALEEFTNLLSGRDYVLRITYTYDLNDGTGNQIKVVETNVKTLSKVAPKVDIINTSSTQTSINYEVTVDDKDGLYVFNKVDLYLGEQLIESKQELKPFEGLLSGKKYTIKVTYSYDLNDGKGIKGIILSKNVITVAKNEPVVEIKYLTSDQTSVSFNIDVQDIDSIYNLVKVELYKNGELVKALENLSHREFIDLLSNTEYVVKVTYSYDLNDGKGVQTKEVINSIFTKEKVAPKVEITNTTSTQTSINYDITIDDKDGLYVFNKVDLYLGEQLIESKQELKPFEGLLSGKKYTIRVTYSFNLNDGKGNQTVEVSKNIFTKEKIAPVVEINNTSSTNTSIYYEVNVIDREGIYVFDRVELYLSGKLVETKTSLEAFNNLLSNKQYTIRVIYKYDLNDGNGLKEYYKEANQITKEIIAPNVTFNNIQSTHTSISYEVNVVDNDGIFVFNRVELYLGQKLIETKKDFTAFTGLYSNRIYIVKVYYTYNLNDGNGVQEHAVTFNKQTLSKETPMVSFTNVTSTQSEIYYEVNVVDKDKLYKLKEIQLLLNGEVVDTKKAIESFTGLLSNTEYVIKVIFTYDLNDGRGIKELSVINKVQTLKKNEPFVQIKYPSSDKTSVSFTIDVDDVDSTYNLVKVELYKNGELVKALENLSHREFIDLLSNTEYVVKVTYSYNLNDGTGVQTNTIETNIKTLAKVAPKVSLSNYDITDTYITADIDLEDVDNIARITKVELYKGNQFFAKNDNLIVDFRNLDYYNNYLIKITYSYDLNEGNGLVTSEFRKSLNTKPYFKLSNFKIINTSAVSFGETIYVQATLDNPLNATYTYIVINGKQYEVAKTSTATRLFVDIVNNGQFEGGDTLLTLESVTTVLNGQTFDVIIDANNTASVFINGSFSVESFKFVDSKLNEIDYTLSNEPVKVLLTVNNKTGYNIDRLSYRAGSQVREVTTFEKIDDNRFLFNYSYYSVTESNEIRITHISYSNQYISKSLNLEDINKYKSVIYLLKGTKHISTIEDLKHVDENYYYILDNDIDLAGIEWRAIYNMVGILDGNNHAILNMTYSTSVKNKTENLGLFDYCSGIVKNLNIKNVLIRAETIENGQINVGILTVNSSRLTVDNCSIDENSIVSLSGNVGPIGGYIGYSEQLLKFKNSNCKANIQGPGNVAGFVGYSMNDIYFDNCYNAGNIIGQSAAGIIVRADNLCSMTNCYNSGYIDGRIYAAGLVNEGQDIKITNCYNTGKIKGGKAGGILGQTISNSSLTNCYNIGEVEGIDAAGGLIANGDNTILTNCYNAGLIKSADYGYKGGLVGCYMGSKPEIINSYTTNVYNIFDVIVTLEQLNEKMFYVDTLKWDETIWNLDALDVSNGIYPTLK